MWIYPQPAQAKPNVQENQTAINQVVDSPPDNGRGVLQPQVNDKPKPTNNRTNKTTRIYPRPQANGKTQTASQHMGKGGGKSNYSGRHYPKEEVVNLIRKYSDLYGVSPTLPLHIAFCESGYNQFSANKHSSARGVYQWLSKSWVNQPASQHGAVSPFDADKNVSAAVWLIAHGKISPWNASKKCWSK